MIGRVSSSLPYTQGASKANVALFTIHPLLWSSYTYTCPLYIYVDTCMHMWSLMSRWRHHNILLATSYDGCKKGQLDKEEKKERNDWSMQQLVQSRSKKHGLLDSREQHAWVSRDLIFSPGWDIEKAPWSGPGTDLNFEGFHGRMSPFGEISGPSALVAVSAPCWLGKEQNTMNRLYLTFLWLFII
jgi:hypothetical protein